MTLFDGKHWTIQTWHCWTLFQIGVEWNFLKGYKDITISLGFWFLDFEWNKEKTWGKYATHNPKR